MKSEVLYLLRSAKDQKAFGFIKRNKDIGANAALINRFFANVVGEYIVDTGKDIKVNTNLLSLINHEKYMICRKEL